MTVLTVLAVSAVVAVSVVTATPLKLNPLFRDPELLRRERKVHTNFLSTNFLKTPRGPGHPDKIPGTSQIPLFETQGRQAFQGEHEVFGHHPFARKTPTPPGGLRTQKVNLCALFPFMESFTL